MSKVRPVLVLLILLNTASCFVTVAGINLIVRSAQHGYHALYAGLTGLVATLVIAIKTRK